MSFAATYENCVGTLADMVLVQPNLESLPQHGWVLGQSFDFADDSNHANFKRVFAALPWMTYRRGFAAIGDTIVQSDTHWGCMLRCGQMVLAKALLDLGALRAGEEAEAASAELRLRVLRQFADDPSAPFSIHRIALAGDIVGKRVGDWFGPNAMAQVIKSLVGKADGEALAVHVAMDGCVCKEDIEETVRQACSGSAAGSDCAGAAASRAGDAAAAAAAAASSAASAAASAAPSAAPGGAKPWVPLVLFVPLRLGLDNIRPEYINTLKKHLELPHSLGALGGRPNNAFYFVGHRGDLAFYLDPHITQQAAVLDGPEPFPIETFSCQEARAMPLASADPSMCLVYLCPTRADYEHLLDRFAMVDAQLDGVGKLFEVTDKAANFDLDSGDDFAVSDDDEGFELVGRD